MSCCDQGDWEQSTRKIGFLSFATHTCFMMKIGIGPLLSFIAEGLILFNRRGDITLVNPHASLLLDFTQEEIIGHHIDYVFRKYLDDEQLDEKNGIANSVFDNKKIFTTPKGNVIYFESHGKRKFPVFVSARSIHIDGEETGILIFRDITIEKKLENYRITTAKRLTELTPILQQVATGNFSAKIPLPKNEDEFTELLVGLTLMLDDLQELGKANEKYARDLERKVEKKTQQLQHAKAHTDKIIENLSSGLIEYDESFSVRRINSAAEQMLGVSRKNIIGRVIAPEDIENKELCSLAMVFYSGLAKKVRKLSGRLLGIETDMQEITIHHPSDRELQITTAVLPETDRRRRNTLKVIHDISREKIISRSKSEFISIAAHQLRTPLSGIKWSLRTIIDGEVGAIGKKQKELLGRAYDTNEEMIRLVNELLNVARIEDGRFGYDFKKNDLVKLLSHIANDAQMRAQEQNIVFIFHKPLMPIKPFVFDEVSVSLAVQNFVDNAIKYTLPKGTVSLSARKRGKYICVAISDTGVGVPKKQMDRLFSKFFRAENVVHMRTAGSGLGLFIVRNIITRHGGTVSVDSEEGKGSTFSFTLPQDEKLIPSDEEAQQNYFME